MAEAMPARLATRSRRADARPKLRRLQVVVFPTATRARMALGLALLCSACATPTVPIPTDVATTGMPNAEAALRQSMQHVDAEMAELGQLTPAVERSAAPIVPDDLQRTVSFEWSGPLDGAVAKLAASIGYTFYTTGPAGQQPVPVAITISSVPVYQVFQALGEEAGSLATVQVDPQHHQVQVIHHV